ncbi:transposase [Bifidobacterium pseudolongum]|uniref:transposase n=1 Tax=Bifidobacterium pseudolongum TaxID=1694 RepID=UPI001F10847B|nr:transposase [Bifidobacterium pseudolongum]MCH4862455.1 transposase [Bifidobacterium pseudolongum]
MSRSWPWTRSQAGSKPPRACWPHAVEAGDPFHVVHLATGRLTMVRCRLQREATGRRGVKGERLYECRRALLKTAPLRTPRQRERIDALLADPVNDALRLAHGVYQRIIACYWHKDPRLSRRMIVCVQFGIAVLVM